MSPVEEQLARLKQNQGDWNARAELGRLWKERDVHFEDYQLLSGAVGSPRDRDELQRMVDALGGPLQAPCWEKVLNEYLKRDPQCPLGLVSLAHVTEAFGDKGKARDLYRKAIKIDKTVAEPSLKCLPKREKSIPIHIRIRNDPKLLSLTVAVMAHLLIIILLSFWAVHSVSPSPPQFKVSAPPEGLVEAPRPPPKMSRHSANASPTNMSIVSTSAPSNFSVSLSAPTVSAPSLLVGGEGFSPSMNFGAGSGGSVSFFGSQGKTKNLVYVVDVSGSMQAQGENGKSRFELMKEELSRSVSALPLSVKFQIIFFSNTAWFAGQERNVDGMTEADDPDLLPTRLLLRATRSQIRKTLEQIEGVPMGGGTNWRLPLKMAIKLRPDLIYFMTDGEVDAKAGEVPVIEDVVSYNRQMQNSKINTICLMEIKAYKELQELANRTRGTVFLVNEDGKILRGMEIDRVR